MSNQNNFAKDHIMHLYNEESPKRRQSSIQAEQMAHSPNPKQPIKRENPNFGGKDYFILSSKILRNGNGEKLTSLN